MSEQLTDLVSGLIQHAPFDRLPDKALPELNASVSRVQLPVGAPLFEKDQPLAGVYVIEAGAVDTLAPSGQVILRRGHGEMLGERGLLASGKALQSTRVSEDATLYLLQADTFHSLTKRYADFGNWFVRNTPTGTDAAGLTALRVRDLMTDTPITCGPDATTTEAAREMRDRKISSLIVMKADRITGIITTRDLTDKVLAEGLPGTTEVAEVMSRDPQTIDAEALGLDALARLAALGVSHLPVADRGRIVGMIGKTDLIRRQAATASHMVAEVLDAPDAETMAEIVARVPALLAHLVATGVRHDAVSRRITDITDAVTRRLLTLAEDKLGPPPVPYLWLACGSQGRREQTGVSDQDNCLILDNAANKKDDTYFAALAKFVCDGLNTCGFVYCPGDMMATNPRWRQRAEVWQGYFADWIAQPDNEAQMLASVMFDLRPIDGEFGLFDDLHRSTLERARANSIFVAHMIANSLKHAPPLGLLRGLALIRSGQHKNTVDLKHSGVVPVVDLGRVYALKGAIEAVGTRARLEAAGAHGVTSDSGAAELLDAYDFVAEIRLSHQAAQIHKGLPPDNFMPPADLSDLERNHLRDAFMVIKTMQSALGHRQAMLG